jgi:hypothetical protein
VRARFAALAAVCLAGITSEAGAQIVSPGPPGPYVIDLRGATSAIPSGEAFVPPVPSGTRLPTRGAGVEAGAHVYLFRLGPSRVGLGAAVLRVRGGASPQTASSASGGSAVSPTPDVDAALTVLASHVSFNFGTGDGWSYLSAGAGRARVTAVASPVQGSNGTGSTGAGGGSANSGSLSSANIGGGARWFLGRHFGISFDVRMHLIGAGASDGERPATPRANVTAATVGISVR